MVNELAKVWVKCVKIFKIYLVVANYLKFFGHYKTLKIWFSYSKMKNWTLFAYVKLKNIKLKFEMLKKNEKILSV